MNILNKEFQYVTHANGGVSPFTVSTLNSYNLVEGTSKSEVHVDLTYNSVVDLTNMDAIIEIIDDDETKNTDDTDSTYCPWAMPPTVNAGTSTGDEEVEHLTIQGGGLYGCFVIKHPGLDDEASVVSRLTMEDDDEGCCLKCASKANGGWKNCVDCYRAHYRA